MSRCSLNFFFILLISCFCNSLALSQSCNIIFPNDTEVENRERSYRSISQSSANFVPWQGLNNGILRDGESISVELDPSETSETLSFSQFNLNIPEGSEISGLTVIVYGNSIGARPRELQVQLTNPTKIGANSLNVYAGTSWPSETGEWQYGSSWYSWGLSLTPELLNDNNFGLDFKITNPTDEALVANIDRISIRVKYRPPYSACIDHACIIAGIQGAPQGSIFDWDLPSGFSVISEADNEEVIVFVPDNLTPGTFELCASPQFSSEECCEFFTLEDCRPGNIGDLVWEDKNGNGLQDPNEVPLAGISISLFDEDRVLVAETVSNQNGIYQFTDIPNGTYFISVTGDNLNFAPADVGSDDVDSDISQILGPGTSDFFILLPGEDRTNIDIGITPLFSVSGVVWDDLDADGIRENGEPFISGQQINLINSVGNLIETTATLSDGSYSFIDMANSSYTIEIVPDADQVFTIPNQGVETLDSDFDTNGRFFITDMCIDLQLDAGLYRNASVGDFIWLDLNRNGIIDGADTGLDGIPIRLVNLGGAVVATTITQNGNYGFDDITPGAYTLEIVPGSDFIHTTVSADNGSLSFDGTTFRTSVTLISGQTDLNRDFGFQFVPASISGFTWLDNDGDGFFGTENNIDGIEVSLFTEAGILVSTILTDASGNYTFDLLNPGNYYVTFEQPNNLEFVLTNGDSTVEEDIAPGATDIIAIGPGEDIAGINAGYFEFSNIGDFIWIDANRNGIQDPSEAGIANLDLILRNVNTNLLIPTTTDTNGRYDFGFLPPSTYQLSFTIEDDLIATIADAGNGFNDSRSLMNFGNSFFGEQFIVSSGVQLSNLDYGFQFVPGSISGYTFLDANANGVDDADNRISEVNVSLFNDAGQEVANTLTVLNGTYTFDNLNPGSYYIVFETMNNFEFTTFGVDSDVSQSIVSGSTDFISLAAGEMITQVNAGYFQRAQVGDFVWQDMNNNGIQDINEQGIPNTNVMITNQATGAQISQNTLTDGSYLFSNLLPGNYFISVNNMTGFTPTLANAGNGFNDSRDLNVQGSVFTTEVFSLSSGDIILNQDFGFRQMFASVSGTAFNDFDADGNFDNGETPFPNVNISLLNIGGNIVATGQTDASGNYTFSNIIPGSYYVVFEPFSNLMFSPLGNNSTVSGAFGNGSTSSFTLVADQDLQNIGVGYFGFSSIGDFLWFDENENGIQDPQEPGVPNISVELLDDNLEVIASQSTDAQGLYLFNNLLPGDYIVRFNYGDNFISTQAGAGNGANDSDIMDIFGTGSTTLFPLGFLEDRRDIDGGILNVVGSISGSVFTDFDANGLNQQLDTPLAGIPVSLFDAGGNIVAQTMSGMDGTYLFNNLLPGNYFVQFGLTNDLIITQADFGNDDTIDSDVTEANGPATTDIITLNPMANLVNIDLGVYQFASIGDMVWIDDFMDSLDDNVFQSTEAGALGVEVSLIDAFGSLLTSVFTDVNGNYLFNDLKPGVYQVRFDAPENFEYVLPDAGADDTIDSDAINTSGTLAFTNPFMVGSGVNDNTVDAGLVFSGFGTLSGLVWEDLNFNGIQSGNEPLESGVQVQLFNEQGILLDTQMTASDGTYQFTDVPLGNVYLVFGLATGQIATTPNVGMDDMIDSDLTSAIVSSSTDLISITVNGDIQNVNAGFYRSASVGDMVWFDDNENGLFDTGEIGINGVAVQLLDVNGVELATTTTESVNGQNGQYSFTGLAPGNYQIGFALPGILVFTASSVGADDSIDSDVLPVGSAVGIANVTLVSGQNNIDIDAGAVEPDQLNISGFAFTDKNGNGVKDTLDIFDNGITVNLFDESGNLVDTQITTTGPGGEDGFYSFDNIVMAAYYLEFVIPTGSEVTDADVGINDLIDSDITGANGPGTTDLFDFSNTIGTVQICGGYFFRGSIGDFLWIDLNENGIQDPNEDGVDNVMISLFDNMGNPVDATFSGFDQNGNSGFYTFFNVRPGDYYVLFNNAGGIQFTAPSQGTDTSLDSDITNANGAGTTDDFSVCSGEMITDIDAGLVLEPAKAGNLVWLDLNANGIQDPLEPGLDNVVVELYDVSNTLIATQNTDADGFYLFDDIQPGNYYLVFLPPGNEFVSSPNDLGGDDTRDSDVMNIIAQGATNIFNLSPGECDMDLDAGFFIPSRIGDFVWDDLNQNGIQDPGEPGVEGVAIELRLGTFFVIDDTVTDANGFYEFTDLTQGTYSLVFSNIPAGYNFSPMNAGNDDELDSEALANGETPQIALAHGVDLMNIDVGIFDPTLQNAFDKFEIVSWPQPVQDRLIHYIDSPFETPISWKIISIDGNIVKSGTERDLFKGNNRFILDVSNIPVGNYIIRYDFKGFYKTKNLMKF